MNADVAAVPFSSGELVLIVPLIRHAWHRQLRAALAARNIDDASIQELALHAVEWQ